jgi:hypothetical protein
LIVVLFNDNFFNNVDCGHGTTITNGNKVRYELKGRNVPWKGFFFDFMEEYKLQM